MRALFQEKWGARKGVNGRRPRVTPPPRRSAESASHGRIVLVGLSARSSKRVCSRCGESFGTRVIFCPNDGAALELEDGSPETDRYIGTVIHGDIQIESVAGVGAMGRVYRARQRGIDRDVAVKILHRELSGNLPLVQRFHREAKIASKLQHPHVVDVYLAGQLPDGALYIVMEYLDGMSLAAAMTAAGGAMPVSRALPIVLQICDAVGEGHARGIIHRDLKPENVMLVRRTDTRDWVKVLDFGIAKVSIGEQSMETAAGLVFGSARYISPEGAQGAAVKPPGDVYSIAVVLYQLLAGRTPFEAEQPVGLLVKHIHDAPPPLESCPRAANVPPAIARVVMDNLAKDPSARAANARAFGNALVNAAERANLSFSDVGFLARLRAPEAETLAPVDVAPSPSSDGLSSVATGPSDLVAALPIVTASAATSSSGDLEGPRSSDDTSLAVGSPKRSVVLLVLLAFLLGGALAALATQHLVHRPDPALAERSRIITRTRTALARGRYVDPPGNNVRDLVAAGLAKWPDDPELVDLQSVAAHEMVTRAMAVRSGGDVAGARELVRTAHDLDPTDGTARLLLAQYDDELASSESDGGDLGGPRVTLDVPTGRARAGLRAELSAMVSIGSSRPSVHGPQFVVVGPGLGSDGVTLAAQGSGPFKASLVLPTEGLYEIEFEANVEGATVRASRSLSVSR